MDSYFEARFSDIIENAVYHTIEVIGRNKGRIDKSALSKKYRTGIFANSLEYCTRRINFSYGATFARENYYKYSNIHSIEFCTFMRKFHDKHSWEDVAVPCFFLGSWNQKIPLNISENKIYFEINKEDIKRICLPARKIFLEKTTTLFPDYIEPKEEIFSEKEPDSLVLLERSMLEMIRAIDEVKVVNLNADLTLNSLADFAEKLEA
jgi:hypothetical protein